MFAGPKRPEDAEGEDDGTIERRSESDDSGPGIDESRLLAQEVIEGSNRSVKLNTLDGEIDQVLSAFTSVSALMQDEEVKAAIGQMETEAVSQWQEDLAFMGEQRDIVAAQQNLIRDITAFATAPLEDDPADPGRFVDSIRAHYNNILREDPDALAAIETALGECEAKHADKLANWKTITPKERGEVIDDFWNTANIGTIVETIEAELKARKDALQKHKEQLESLQLARQKSKDEDKDHQQHGGFFRRVLGIKFYSILEVIAAFKQIKDAYVHAFQEKTRLGAGQFAKDVSPLLKWGPYGHDVAHHIDADFESQNAKVTNEEKERLTRENVSFRGLFLGEHGHSPLLTEYLQQGLLPKARGVIEYAASRGWLYDIDEIGMESSILGIFRLRDVVPGDWSDDRVGAYFTRLRGMNRSGLKEEREKVKNRENKDSFDLFLGATQSEFEKLNLWGAVGVMERAIERGLSDVTITRLSVEVLRQIRENPEVYRYASKCREFIDQIGILSMYRTTPTLGWFKWDRKKIQAWLQRGGKDIADATTLGKAVKLIEEEVGQKVGEVDDNGVLDDLVSKVLTGQVIDFTNEKTGRSATFTLFQPRYDFYISLQKNDYFRNQGAAKPLDEDIDYYTADTDQLLTPPGNVKLIARYGSTREFENETFTKLFFAKFIRQSQKQRKSGDVARYRTFLREARARLDPYCREQLMPLEKLGAEKLSSVQFPYPDTNAATEAPMFAALVADGLVSPSVFFDERGEKEEFAKRLEQQLRSPPFNWNAGEIESLKRGVNPHVGY